MWERLTLGHERLDAGNPYAHYSLQRSLAAYAFARRYLSGKRVLDAACGTGHGTRFLAGVARILVGLDHSLEALRFAVSSSPEGARFCCGDLLKLPFRDQSLDAVLCFQVIEHFSSAEPLLKELSRVLRQGGVLLIATLNDKKTSHGLNPFHIHEYVFDEFSEAIRRHFPSSAFYGVFGSPNYLKARRSEAFFGKLFLRLDRFNLRSRLPRPLWETLYTLGTYLVNLWVSQTIPSSRELTVDDFEIGTENLDGALDFIAVCSKEPS